MSGISAIPAALGLDGAWDEKNGSRWISPLSLDVRRMAAFMTGNNARFVTITAMELPEGEGIRLDYHWDLNGELLTFTVLLQADKKIPSIYDLCLAADWIEREIHEYFCVDFEGRDYEPLLIRRGDPLGINLHEEDE